MKNQRQDEIIKYLSENRMVKASDLVKKYNVTMETIRRDLEFLESRGQLTRVFGGAVAKSMRGMEPAYTFREIKNYEHKIAIGRAAAQLVEDGDTIIVDIGTTTLEFSKFLHNRKNITVFTNGVQIASEISKNMEARVILLGGNLRPGELSTSGFIAENNIDQFCVDKVFLGVGGLTLSNGIGDYNIEEANLRRHYVAHAQKVIALADYSKLGVSTLNHVCDLKELNILVTDWEADKKLLYELKRKQIDVVIGEA